MSNKEALLKIEAAVAKASEALAYAVGQRHFVVGLQLSMGSQVLAENKGADLYMLILRNESALRVLQSEVRRHLNK